MASKKIISFSTGKDSFIKEIISIHERKVEKDRERQRKTEKDRKRQKKTEKDRRRKRDRERQRKVEKDRDRDRDRDKVKSTRSSLWYASKTFLLMMGNLF